MTSRLVIDVAIGVLMGLRGCSEKDAFDDRVDAVHETGIGPGSMARALVNLVGGASEPFPHRPEAVHRWGHLMAARLISVNTPAD
jgi:hypothetical protein